MKFVNAFFALLLAVAAAFLGILFLGFQEQHAEMLEQHFWGTLLLRFIFASVVGLMGAALWWGVNWGLLKSGLVPNINLRKTALLVVAGVLSGALAGALFFCMS